MIKVFSVSWQVCKRAPANAAGPRDEYRRPVEEALIVATDPRDFGSVIGAHVGLKPGEDIEIVQHRQLGRGMRVFSKF
jgi:hypothetical protein